EIDLVLLDEPADAGDLRNSGDRGQPVPEIPVLQTAKVGERALTSVIDERVLEHPAHTGRIGTNRRIHSVGKLPANALQVLDDPAAGPVDVGVVLEDDVDVRNAEVGEPANGFHVRR